MSYPKGMKDLGYRHELISCSNGGMKLNKNFFLPLKAGYAFRVIGTIDTYLLFREVDGWVVSGVFKAVMTKFFESQKENEIIKIGDGDIYVDVKVKFTSEEDLKKFFEKFSFNGLCNFHPREMLKPIFLKKI